MAFTEITKWSTRPPLSIRNFYLTWLDFKWLQCKAKDFSIREETQMFFRETCRPLRSPDTTERSDPLVPRYDNNLDGIDEMLDTKKEESGRWIQEGDTKTTTIASILPNLQLTLDRVVPPSTEGGNSSGKGENSVDGLFWRCCDFDGLMRLSSIEKQLEEMSINDPAFVQKRVVVHNGETKKLMQILKSIGVTSEPTLYKPQPLRKNSSEIFCKNLFLKDRKGQFYLVICDEDADLDLKCLRRKIKACRNFSFANNDELMAILKLYPGGVTPFAVLHETARDIRVVMTTDVARDDVLLNFHPLDQTLTVPITFGHLLQFLNLYRFELEVVDMSE